MRLSSRREPLLCGAVDGADPAGEPAALLPSRFPLRSAKLALEALLRIPRLTWGTEVSLLTLQGWSWASWPL